jgi:hypothetical protein
LNVLQLREKLKKLSEEQLSLPYKDFIRLCIERCALEKAVPLQPARRCFLRRLPLTGRAFAGACSKAATSEPEAERVADALDKAAVVLRFRGLVFIRPDEVAERLLESLPDQSAEYLPLLARLEAELDKMEQTKRAIDAAAHRHVPGVPLSGQLWYMSALRRGICRSQSSLLLDKPCRT